LPAHRPIYAMLTHPGLVRQGNEDACAASPKDGVFIVCDGMGGAAAGEVASHLAASTFIDHLAVPTSESFGLAHPPKEPTARITAAIRAANHAIFEKARHAPELCGMGTTLVALLHAPPIAPTAGKIDHFLAPSARHEAAPPNLWLAHVGDSRCYLYRNKQLTQLTDDHSLVEEQFRAGQITAAEAARSPMRNFITRAVGSQSTVEIDVQALTAQPGDLYLLASDGLNRELSDPDIATVLADIPSPATEPYLMAACSALITAVNDHGGRDNTTVMLVAFTRGVERRKSRRVNGTAPHLTH
jgi:serine/threonine protein phosphatase PrpC